MDVTIAAWMKNVRPKTNAMDLSGLKLSPEEGFVLSRVDGATSVGELVTLTGIEESRVVEIVGRLASEGAIDVGGTIAAEEPDLDAKLRAFLRGDTPEETEAPIEVDAEEPAEPPANPDEEGLGGQGAEPRCLEPEAREEEQRNERSYRQIYETVYHPMSRNRRMKAAEEVSSSDLLALCFDPDPQIVHAILTNPRAGSEHARLVALHHRTQIGLEAIAKRNDYLKDALIQRRLLRNPQLPATILHRMVNPKLLLDVYKIAIDREIPERSRVMTRETLRKKFMLASADEKASLLFKTEGRCLVLLVQCSLDAHATQMLCGKSNYTMLFIQNLARWSATPPPLLAHLVKVPVVRRNQGLRKMLLKHPNMPSEAKRSLV